jgi:predicted metal-dependent HD superfamily phosphohydrolase
MQDIHLDCPASLLDRVAARYAEPHRHYHTWSHVLACLRARDAITSAAIPEVDLALVFHDAVYEPFANDNEERSADLLVEEGRRAWLDERVLQRARPLVLATKHASAEHVVDDSEEVCIVLDADLSILGADASLFDAYEVQVRKEYAAVEPRLYASARGRVLRAFLERPSVYQTRRGRTLWEESARSNIERSLARLDAG